MSSADRPHRAAVAAPPDGESFSLSRRLLLGVGLAAVTCVAPSVAVPSGAGSIGASVLPSTRLGQMRLLIRLMASLQAARVPWFYTGRIYVMRAGMAPLHLVNFEGSEIYWIKPIAADRWSLAASTLTFYRDRISGEYLNRLDNPLTGETVTVMANALRSTPGRGAIYTADSLEAMGERQPVTLEIHRSGDVVWLTTSRATSRAQQPAMEINTLFGSVHDLDERAEPSAAATFSSVSASSWTKWLHMGDLQGHLLWHAAGRKLGGLAELPADYRRRADATAPVHFENPDAVTDAASRE